MKKYVAIAIALLLVMVSAVAFAVTYDETLDIDVVCPEGYEVVVDKLDAYLLVELTPVDETKPALTMLVCPDEDYADLARLNDLSDEEMAVYVETLLEGYNEPTWEVRETALGTKILVINENNGQMDYAEGITVYMGYTVDVYLQKQNGEELTEDDLAFMMQFLTDLTFVENK